MVSEEKVLKMTEILSNEDNLKVLGKVKTADELQDFFKERGIEVNVQDFEEYITLLYKFKNDVEELTEDELEMIVGGKINWNKVGMFFNNILTMAMPILNIVGSVLGIKQAREQARANEATGKVLGNLFSKWIKSNGQ